MSTTGECKYHPGQVWDYKTRPSEPLSTLTILKVSTPLGETIVHIAIDDVHITDLSGEEIAHSITHAPITPEALDRSVTELVRESGPIPDFAEGYADWKADWDKEEGGVFIATVAEVVTLMENSCRYGTDVEPTQ
jgi:hypothetical protein